MASGPHHAGLRVVALFEGAKGALVLFAGFGLLSLIHQDVQRIAEEIVPHLHINPASRYPRIFQQASAALTSQRLWLLASMALLYSALRLIEAYGLWRSRRWAHYFAVISGGLYLPVEIYELFLRPTWTKALVVAVNTGVVTYLVWRIGYGMRQQARND
jgi:uncharacterized membrane protein (DUF2068 family)